MILLLVVSSLTELSETESWVSVHKVAAIGCWSPDQRYQTGRLESSHVRVGDSWSVVDLRTEIQCKLAGMWSCLWVFRRAHWGWCVLRMNKIATKAYISWWLKGSSGCGTISAMPSRKCCEILWYYRMLLPVRVGYIDTINFDRPVIWCTVSSYICS